MAIVSGGGSKASFWISRDHIINDSRDSVGEISLVDPYACAIHVEGKYFNFRKAAGHIPREISRYIYCFVKKEEGSITVKILSVKYRSSSIPSEGLEISLILKVNSSKSITFLNMKQLVNEQSTLNMNSLGKSRSKKVKMRKYRQWL